MSDDERRLPSTNRPLHAAPRPQAPALIGVALLVLVILGVFALITAVRYLT